MYQISVETLYKKNIIFNTYFEIFCFDLFFGRQHIANITVAVQLSYAFYFLLIIR